MGGSHTGCMSWSARCWPSSEKWRRKDVVDVMWAVVGIAEGSGWVWSLFRRMARGGEAGGASDSTALPPTSLSASALPRPLRAGLHQILILEHYGCVQLEPDHLIHLEVEQQNLGGRGQQATEFYAAAWTDTRLGRKRDEARKLSQTWLDFNHLLISPVLT